MLTLRPMTQAELDALLPVRNREYAEEEVRAGRDHPDTVHANVEAMMARLLPDGVGTAGHLMFAGEADGVVVGHIWLALPDGKRPQAWVYDIHVDAAHRGEGYGRALMLAAEEELKARGVTRLGLNVFGPNTVARRLYESLGYEPTALQMSKELA
ncbi:GNAT family N-acetyltransferase [Dactylosporangium sp. NPDC048998]|uniref:GNAT family N-acetyltransferase n=1 Tax=Dactylosporangium sp. NPDC048998 TaxID=3363976 RepID=UPI003713F662